MKISPARIAAFEILRKIETEESFSSVLLPVYEEKLAPKDRALCHNLTLGTLRKQIYLDRAIDKFVSKKLDAEVRVILRLGLFQLLFLDKIPAYSAINEAVNLTVKAKKTSAKNLVNAVLRRATREPFDFEFADQVERISVETSHPRWLIEKWSEQFGSEETKKLATANNRTPASVFRLTAKSDENTINTLKKLGAEISESETVEGAWKFQNSNEYPRLFAADGKIYFQDEASQVVAQAVRLNENERFLDLCAAPGSKTTQIAAENRALKFFHAAGDFYEHRAAFLKSNCRRQGTSAVNIVCYDAENALPFADQTFDAILIDAPCSGTGTIAHNPEIRYFIHPTDFAELAAKQLNILQTAARVLKRNGRIVYSTCSLETEENEAVIEKFLAGRADFVKAKPHVADRFLTTESFGRTFPQRDATDGFFISMLIKK